MQNSIAPEPTHRESEGSRERGRPQHCILDLLTWAGRDPGLTPPNKAVLLAIVAHADEHGVCTASDQALATASHTSVQTVQRTLLLFQGHRVLQRTKNSPRNRSVRLLPREQSSVVVDVVEPGVKQQQQQDGPGDCSPVSSPPMDVVGDPGNGFEAGTEGLVVLLTDRGVTEEVARTLVRDFPDRIAAQVEAHKKRKVWNVAGSLVIAIKQNWASVRSQSPPSPKEQNEETRKEREADRKATLDAQAVENARKRAEEKAVVAYWDGLSQEERDVLDDEAIEASPHRAEIRSLDPDTPIFRGQKAAARWEHIRRKLGLGVEG